MSTPLSRTAPLTHAALVALVSTLLAACGGGGEPSSGSPGATAPAPPVSAAPPAPPAPPATVSGVAALGAPLAGARLSIIDAQGLLLGSTRTNASDGSYALELNSAAPRLPLLLQVAGHDATGRPVLLHSALAELPTRAVAHLTPLTDAAVALTLGTDPAKVFAQPAAYASTLAGLAKVGVAADFVRNLVKTNLADTKMAGAATVNLLSTPGFVADKTGVDLALETLDIGISQSSRGTEQLQLANKLGAALSEVTVDLAAASVEIAKATGAAPASAITSTLKATTSPTTLMPRLANLDRLQVAINSAIASGGGQAATQALTSAYVRHNGRNADDLAGLIQGWADRNMQMGRLQVIGCADATIGTAGCVRVALAARLFDASGAQSGSFSDVATYDTRTLGWNLVGNNQPAAAVVQALAWRALDASGTAMPDPATNPRLGVQLSVESRLGGARVQMPGGHVLSLVPCERAWLCTSATTGTTSTPATGMPTDHAVFQPGSAWLGTADLAAGARYGVTMLSSEGETMTRSTALRRAFTVAPAAARFAVLDEVDNARPLASATLLAGRTLSWQAWAAANPDMRVVSLRLVLDAPEASEAALVIEPELGPWQTHSLELPATTLPESHASSNLTLWLVAMDSAGRLYTTSYARLPVN